MYVYVLIPLKAETMQRSCEASPVGLQGKGHPHTLQCSGNQPEGTVEVKDESHAPQSVEVVKADRGPNSKLVESSNTCYKGNNYPHDISPWLFHPDSNNVQLCQMSAFDGHLYPVSVDNRFQHVPINIFPPYPFEPLPQDFHYFVVIDFEATCDKAKNPHPQEIIEFPSVIVSSMTGQLEACFQTYVRPTCNQMLSEFCKDLTGIQQIQVCIVRCFFYLVRCDLTLHSSVGHSLLCIYHVYLRIQLQFGDKSTLCSLWHFRSTIITLH